MEIKIKIPIKADIVFNGFPIMVAPAGITWKKEQLGDYADRSGVYIHHCDGKILYVGMTTTGQWGTFSERLRREFQETSSSNSSLYKLLCNQNKIINTFMLDLDDVDMLIDCGPMAITKGRKALIMEQILIDIFDPPGNKI